MDKEYNLLVVEGERCWFELLQIEAAHHKAKPMLNAIMSGKKALEAMEKGSSYDAILIGVRLPDMEGIELAKRLRAMAISTPILAWGAWQSELDERASLAAGINGWIEKSASPILDKVLAWCR